jgi:ERCC4-type nuclease
MLQQGLYWELCAERTGAVMRIIADCHEPAEILNLLRTADGVEIEAGSLDDGDYLIGPGAAVERSVPPLVITLTGSLAATDHRTHTQRPS